MKIDQAVAALREALRIERLLGAEAIEREAAHGGVAAGEEPLARRQILDDVERSGSAVGDRERPGCPWRHRAAAALAAKPDRQAEARAGREHDAAAPGRRRYTKPCMKRLDEADFRAEDARRHRAVDADHRAALRIEHVVARVAQHAAEELRQPHLREQAIDQQLIFRRRSARRTAWCNRRCSAR